ncbi:alpha/beta-hydrolase [Rhizoctonia solani]|nr:alpha/beta-hydrolase [Rhizoctonia solani]
MASVPEPVARLRQALSAHGASPEPRSVVDEFVSRSNKTLKPADFLVNSSALPLITFPLQDSYAGRLPISGNANETGQLSFWYWPSSTKAGSKKLSIWLNGGPGCSSFLGFLTENGPISFQAGAAAPSFNPYTWTKASDMLWIEQPIGTGFTLGTANLTNEIQLSDQFYGFLSVFPDLIKKELYFTGESYAGMYIPYITSRIINASPSEKKSLPLNLQSFLIIDGVYASFITLEDAPIYNFAKTYQQILGINATTLESMRNITVSCGYQAILDKVTYPPKGLLYDAAEDANPCFNIYRITDKCPTPSKNVSLLGSRPDVQSALHFPNFGNWSECVPFDKPVFIGHRDYSEYTETLFPSLLSKLPKGFSLWHGVEDALLLSEGTKIMIQNLTWGGSQGFSKPPSTPLVVGGEKKGVYRTERKLTYIEFDSAGHMIPEDQPAAALHAFRWMLYGGKL